MNNQKIAVIGMGMWGKNIVRNFYNLNVLEYVCDLDDDSLKTVREQFPGVKTTKDFNEVLNNPEITGVAVVTAKKVDPVQVETIVSMICLPSFEQADKIYIIDTTA